jgi:DNA mismatch endonuclease (patch repair protein)
MTDIVAREVRSRMMSGIRGKDTKPELLVRRFLHRRGLRYRLHGRALPGRPDLVLARFRTVIFVNGCFWHSHQGCRYAYRPKANGQFWKEKLARTTARDAEAIGALVARRWQVLTVWECELSLDALFRLEQAVRGQRSMSSIA